MGLTEATKNIEILTVNLTGYDKSIVSSIIQLADYPDIVLLQETFTYNDKKLDIKIDGYDSYHQSAMDIQERRRGRPYGGLITYVKTGMQSQKQECTSKTNRILAVDIGDITIVNCYLPYAGHPDKSLYDLCISDLDNLIDNSTIPIVAGDLNPTGSNQSSFTSFLCDHDLTYDPSVKFTFIEPVNLATSLLDYA